MAGAKTKHKTVGEITKFIKTDCDYSLEYSTGEKAKLTLLHGNVFRFYMSPTGEFLDYPTPRNPTDVAKINSKSVQDYGQSAFENSFMTFDNHRFTVKTDTLKIMFNKFKGTLMVHDKRVGKVVLKEHAIEYSDDHSTQSLLQNKDEFYYAGGMQNGRFSHKHEVIQISNTNNWVDGGVTSPSPFFWSTFGYGVLRNTWKSGTYDFGSKSLDKIRTTHEEAYFDAFYFIDSKPQEILNDYYELTGRPLLMPEFAFYEAHLNTFNRDYWVEVDSTVKGAVLYEDDKYYKSYHPDQMDGKTGFQATLNGEKVYTFSARAMIDRYCRLDIPLGLFVPNDGYGSGYGQTDSLDGDLKNLKHFAEYAKAKGVELGLWTECNLEPKDPNNPKKGERDLSKEIGVGTVALKCDVAWIGEGYSFGLNAVEHATEIFIKKAKTSVRPFIIMVDGWAGTQRYAGIWSGDQTGGEWEYIRFHIPTYIGAGLSGMPVVGSDMDGIYGGGDIEITIREFQWKTFTPLQLNMDGWGNCQKTPFSNFNGKLIAMTRAYLKFKSMLLPYNYSIAYESLSGLPMVRAMFLEFPNDRPAYTTDSQYQYMWGPSLLIAPIYKKAKSVIGKFVRNGVFLPDQNQVWVDIFTGKKYQGGKIYNNIKTPIWKIPVFVRDGAIIPLVHPNNNPTDVKRNCRIFTIFPNDKTKFELYEDDGKSSEYLDGHYIKTKITVVAPCSNESGDLHITIFKTKGTYNKFVKKRFTLLQVKTTMPERELFAHVNGEKVNMTKADSLDEFLVQKHNAYYYDDTFVINPYLKNLTDKDISYRVLSIKFEEMDITENEIQIKVVGFSDKDKVFGSSNEVVIDQSVPTSFSVMETKTTEDSITLQWEMDDPALYYEIDRDGVIFSNILGQRCTFEDFKAESEHLFKIRSAGEKGVSDWSSTIVAKTKPNIYKNTVEDVTVTCNIPCEKSQEICKVTECDINSLWHTDWQKPGQADFKTGNVIVLTFDLKNLHQIDKIDYIPRKDAGNGTFLQVKYRHSANGKTWADLSNAIDWPQNEATKTIPMNGVKMQFFELHVLNSVGGFGSGRNVLFYKKG